MNMKKFAATTIAGGHRPIHQCFPAMAAADNAIVLKTLASPYWVAMKEGIVNKRSKASGSMSFALTSEDDIQGQQRVLGSRSTRTTKGLVWRRSPP